MHIVGEEIRVGADKICQQRLLKPHISVCSENCVSPMDEGFLIVAAGIESFPSTSSCRLEGKQCLWAHIFSQPFPYSNTVQDQSGGFMVAKSRPVQGFQFLTGNTGTHLVQPQIGWAAPGRAEGAGSAPSAVCCFMILSSGLKAWVSWSSWNSYMRRKVTEVLTGIWRISGTPHTLGGCLVPPSPLFMKAD